MIRSKRIALVLFLVALISGAVSSALAQEADGSGEVMVSSPSRARGGRIPIVDVFGDSNDDKDGAIDHDAVRDEIVDPDDLSRRGAFNLADALSWLAGFTSVDTTGNTQGAAVDGLSAAYVTVLVDGVPIGRRTNTLGGPTYDLAAIPVLPESIDRIEVVRGLGPAGSGGESGVVVNIVTRAPDEASATIRTANGFGEGEWLSRSLSANGETPLGDAFSARLGGQYAQLTGVDVNGDGVFDTTDQTNWGASFELRWQEPGESDRLRARLVHGGQEQRNEGASDGPLIDRTGVRTWDTIVDGAWELDSDLEFRHTTQFGLSRYDLRKEARQTGVERTLADTEEWRVRNDALLRLIGEEQTGYIELVGDHIVVERTGDAGDLPVEELHTVGVALGQRWSSRGDIWQLETRGYGEYASAFDAGWAAQASVARRVASPLTLRTTVSRSRRTPTPEELFLFFDHSDVGYQVAGNPELEPEELTSFRLGTVWTPIDEFGFELEGFYNRIDNVIVNVTEDDSGIVPVFTYLNEGGAHTAGANATVRVSVWHDQLRLNATYAFLPLAENRSTGEAIPLRTTHSFQTELRAFFWQRRLEIWSDVSGRASQTVPDESPLAPGFARFDAGIGVRPDDRIRVLAEVTNLSDATNATWGPKPGRAAFLTLELMTR